MVTVVIDKILILTLFLVIVASLIGGTIYYLLNTDRAIRWKRMNRMTEKSVWWLSGGGEIGVVFTLIILMYNVVATLETWYIISTFNPMSILSIFFIGVATVLMYRIIFKMTVEDPENPSNYK